MRYFSFLIVIFSAVSTLAEDCQREVVQVEFSAPIEYVLFGFAGRQVRIRPQGICREIPSHLVLRYGGTCGEAFAALRQKSPEDFKFSCYQDGETITDVILGQNVESSSEVSCYFCLPEKSEDP